MANEEQLAILSQGVDVWNKWRRTNYTENIDLQGAEIPAINLQGADFREADLHEAILWNPNLSQADFTLADLHHASLSGAYVERANFQNANLRQAKLWGARMAKANLYIAHLDEANLRNANLSDANLNRADLSDASLRGAFLRKANLSEANLNGTDLRDANLEACILSQARTGNTIFGNIDLSSVMGLDDVIHSAPSTIDAATIAKSKGEIPEIFLQGCGLSDWEIQMAKLYNPDLSNKEFIDIQNKIFDLRQHQAIQISPLFISYNHADGVFVDKLEEHLNIKGVRFWRDIHEMKAGRIETQIDRAISQNRTVLLVLSEHSLQSDWVEHEVRTARGLEKEMSRDVLCPVALDDSWKSSRWPKRVMEQIREYNILDFSTWEDDVKFGSTFNKLIDGLELFYKK